MHPHQRARLQSGHAPVVGGSALSDRPRLPQSPAGNSVRIRKEIHGRDPHHGCHPLTKTCQPGWIRQPCEGYERDDAARPRRKIVCPNVEDPRQRETRDTSPLLSSCSEISPRTLWKNHRNCQIGCVPRSSPDSRSVGALRFARADWFAHSTTRFAESCRRAFC